MLGLIFPTGSAMITMIAIGILFGLILSVARLKLKVKKDPRIEEIIEIELNKEEQAMVKASSEAVKNVMRVLDKMKLF